MMKRAEYQAGLRDANRAGSGYEWHRRYYGEIAREVVTAIALEFRPEFLALVRAALATNDRTLRSINWTYWHNVMVLPAYIDAATRALGRRDDDQTEENGICILKEAARQAVERNTH